jgi:drug/metabolite transporter (DMT)-like permease
MVEITKTETVLFLRNTGDLFKIIVNVKREQLIAYIALTTICIVWGTTFLVMRIGVVHFPPFLFVIIRQVLAGVLLLGYMIFIAKESLPSFKAMAVQAIAGFFLISLGNGLVGWAEVHIPSGLAAIICSMVPMVVILINLSNATDKPTWIMVVGTILGFGGILLIFNEHIASLTNIHYAFGIVLTIVSVISWAGASVWLKRHKSSSSPFMNAGLQMFFGAIWLIPFTLVFDDWNGIQLGSEVVFALAYLIVIGSLVGYGCYAYVLGKLPITTVSLYAYINPIVAVLLGWFILDEHVNSTILIAMLVTVGGIVIVTRGNGWRDRWLLSRNKNVDA